MEKDVLDGKKIGVACFSPAFAASLHTSMLEKKKKSLLLVKDTDTSIKKDVFENIDQLENYDIVIYSPTCKVGVSFEKLYFDSIYAFTHRSSDLTSSTLRQMCRRIRKTNENKIYIYVAKTISCNVHPTKERTKRIEIKPRKASVVLGLCLPFLERSVCLRW